MSNGEQRSSGPTTRDETPRTPVGPDRDGALQEQIGQALQPALAQFREQLAATVRRELDQAIQQNGRRPERGGSREPGRAGEDGSRVRDDGRPPRVEAESTDDRARPEPAQPEGPGRAGASESAGKGGVQGLAPALGTPLLGVIPEILEHQGEQWLRSRVAAGLDALFSDEIRATIQEPLEQTLEALLDVAFKLVPNRAARRELQEQAAQTVETLVRGALDTVFAGSVREDLEAHAEQAIRALFQRDLPGVLREGQQGLRALVQGLLAALKAHWEQILHLFLQVVVAVVQDRLSSALKDAFGSIAPAPAKAAEEKGTRAQDAIEEGGQSAVGGGSQGDEQLGRPPSGRPPAGRPPSGASR